MIRKSKAEIDETRRRLEDLLRQIGNDSLWSPECTEVRNFLSLSLIKFSDLTEPTEKNTRDKIIKLRKTLLSAEKIMSDMSTIELGVAHQASGFFISGPNKLRDYIRATILMFSQAEKHWKNDPLSPGRPESKIESGVALISAECFRKITGKVPTIINSPAGGSAYGPFIDFLTCTFAILGLTASAEASGRKAITTLKASRPDDDRA